jgi:hypothetical protein
MRAALALLLLFAIACNRQAPPLSSCIPPQTVWLAGIDLDRVRNTSLGPLLPDNLREASYLMLASRGRSPLFIARGNFAATPAGAELLDPHLALSGPPDLVQAAIAQYKSGVSGSPDLVTRAAPVEGAPIWGVIRGGIALPLSGNLENVNRLLHLLDYATLAIQIDSAAAITLEGHSRDAPAAQHVEETIRALVTLAGASNARLEKALQSTQIARNDKSVTITLTASPETIASLLSQ